MTIHLSIPEDIIRQLEGYRMHALSEEQIRRLLGFDTRMEVHSFLKEHNVYLNYALEEFQSDVEAGERFGRGQ